MTRIKVCGITNLEDALAALEAGADMLGFNFYARSPRYISAVETRRIVESLPEGVSNVGVFVNESMPADVERIAREAGLDAVQLHGDETPEFCETLRGLTTIKALRVGTDFKIESATAYHTDAVLLDAYVADARGGTGHTFDWTLATLTRERVGKLFLAGGLNPDNVAAAVAAVRPYAVDVCSGVETSPGRKSPLLMRRFVEEVRSVFSF
ncbi:MAG: phosphoribosylanthranilate isomerase [Acidobacteriota bacterium]|jgi:phosphoribosylanthranilate isomerase|nr:phosphoribosylanthranilate isomerase [Acidobacteriota bacterium]